MSQDIIVAGPGECIDAEHAYPLLLSASYNTITGQIERKDLDPATGKYTGHKVVLGKGDPSPQGPEIGRYNKGFVTFHQDGAFIKRNGLVVGENKQMYRCSRSPTSEDVWLAFSKMVNGRVTHFYGPANNLDAGVEFPYHRAGGQSFWIADTMSFAYRASIPGQGREMVQVDTETGRATILMEGGGDIIEVKAFWSPEYQQPLLVALDNFANINIYQDKKRLRTLKLPAPWKPHMVKEIDGDIRASKCNKSYVAVVGVREEFGRPESIWLMAPLTGEMRRIDEGHGRRIRGDAEIWLLPDTARKVDEIYVRYQDQTDRGYEMAIARSIKTGVTFPR